MLKYLKTEKVNLPEVAGGNENQDARNGLAHREDSKSTFVHWEYDNVVTDSRDEAPTENCKILLTLIH
jgi:hypothetical protein